MAGVYIYKYEPGNYFEGLDIVDKILINNLPEDAFPVFDISTEDVTGIALYKPGEFDVNISIDTGETSYTLGASIENFFKNAGVNYKYLVAVEFGRPPTAQVFWGRTTQDKIDPNPDYRTRRISLQCKPIVEEVKSFLEGFTVGRLPAGRTEFANFLNTILVAGLSDYLDCVPSFSNYGTLIGNSNIAISNALWNNGAWVNTLDVWSQMIELLIGTGLNYKVLQNGFPTIVMDYPFFYIYIFPISAISILNTPLQIIEAKNTSLFSQKSNLYILYRKWSHEFQDISYGICKTFDNQTLVSDIVDPQNYKFPYFFIGDYPPVTAAKLNSLNYIQSFSSLLIFSLSETNIIELPLYAHDFPGVFGSNNEVAISRTLNDGTSIYGEEYGSSLIIYEYAMNQYSRYIGGLKSVKQLKVVYDINNLYDIWQKVTLSEDGGRSVDYYVSRIENIDWAEKTAEITLIKI